MDEPKYSDISFLLSYFNANAYDPELLPDDMSRSPASLWEKSKADFQFLLKNNRLGMRDFYRATACYAKDEETASRFFRDVYKYAFEAGEEPDLYDYRS